MSDASRNVELQWYNDNVSAIVARKCDDNDAFIIELVSAPLKYDIMDVRFMYSFHRLPHGVCLQCDPGYAAEAFYDLIYRKPQLIMLVATSCSEVAKTLGEIVSYWNLLMVSDTIQLYVSKGCNSRVTHLQ